MRKLKLVTINYQTPIREGLYVEPKNGSGLKFKIGEIIQIKDENYAIVCIGQQNVNIILTKIQPVKFYLVNKENFEVGDSYYYPPTPIQKNRMKWRNYDARIGKIYKELDARLFNLGLAERVIFNPEQIGLMKYNYDSLTCERGSIVPVDSTTIIKIIENNGICYINEELINNKVLMSSETF